MKLIYSCFFFIIIFTSCVSTKNKNYTFNKKYSAAQVQADLKVVKEIYEGNHPSIYWYNSKQTLDSIFNETLASITDSLTEIQAKNKIASYISQIKCGHTSIAYSKQFLALADKNKYPQFPLSIKIWQDSMVVLGYYNKEDSVLKPGTIIKSINGKNHNIITTDIFKYISGDGNVVNNKYQSLTGNFPAWYRNVYGVDSVYTIKYFDSNKVEKTTTIKWYNPKPVVAKKDSTKKTEVVAKPTPKTTLSKREIRLLKIRTFVIDTNINTAFIKLNTFGGGNGLKRFFKKCLKEIEEKQIKNVVFDVRENGGGRVDVSTDLLQYLKKDKFKIADSCYSITRNYTNKKYIKGWFSYWMASNFFSRKMKDGLLHNRGIETKYYTPYTKYHFNGNIYIIQGGYSFSATTIFSSFLKGQDNVTLVGEETGGTYYGNTAMLTPNAYLPNTKLRIRVPTFRYVMDKTRPKGQGVMPDVAVYPKSEAIKNGIDLKIEKVKELIKAKK